MVADGHAGAAGEPRREVGAPRARAGRAGGGAAVLGDARRVVGARRLLGLADLGLRHRDHARGGRAAGRGGGRGDGARGGGACRGGGAGGGRAGDRGGAQHLREVVARRRRRRGGRRGRRGGGGGGGPDEQRVELRDPGHGGVETHSSTYIGTSGGSFNPCSSGQRGL